MGSHADLYKKNVFNENRIKAPSDTRNVSTDVEEVRDELQGL